MTNNIGGHNSLSHYLCIPCQYIGQQLCKEGIVIELN